MKRIVKGGREPSDEEHRLFRDALKDAKPVRAKPRVPIKPAEPKPVPARASRPPLVTEGVAPKVGGHLEMRLRRGRAEPEATLDLHGYREEGAYNALERFLMRACAEDKRLVLVITGKGGVLRENFPRWLAEDRFRNLVSGLSEAHLRHGGSGAFYVAVKRKRPR